MKKIQIKKKKSILNSITCVLSVIPLIGTQ